MSKNNFIKNPKDSMKRNRDTSDLQNKMDALDELNKKIPINIDKTLDPANNSIGLYGLADMEKRNKAILKATRDTYKSEIKKAEKDMWAKDPIDYVVGTGKEILNSISDRDVGKITKTITKEALKIKNVKTFKEFKALLKIASKSALKSVGKKFSTATKSTPWLLLVDYIIEGASNPESGLFRLYHYNTKLDTLNKAGSFTNITDSEAYKNTVKARNSSSHGNSKYQGTPYSSNPVEDTNFLKEFYEEMWTKQYPILENDFSKEFETSLPEDIIKKNEILQRYYKAKEQNKFFDQNVDISYTKERFPSFKALAKVLNLSPTSIHNTRPEPKFSEAVSEETTGVFGNMADTTVPTDTVAISAPAEENKPNGFMSILGNAANTIGNMASRLFLGASEKKKAQYVNISREELRAKYKAHRAREIQNDPSMEYFYSSKYQDEHQNMFGTISCSNINPSEANNFSSPVGGSFTSPFSSLSNEIAPFKIPPFLTIDDILRNPKIKEFAQNIAGNEAHKQLCSYDRELHESFQEESPLSDEDRSTMEDAHDLIAYINRVGSEVERANELEREKQERRSKNPVV